jgi:uncharacterized protein YndB with AHSA1/START domain
MSQPQDSASATNAVPPPSRGSLLKKLLLGAAAIVAAFAGYVAIQSPEFRITRETRVAASPEKVFPHLVDFRKGDAWNPWSKLDPDMKQTFEGPESGLGAKHSWTGNDKVGAGRQEIVEVTPNEKVRTRLVFERPMQAENEAVFTLRPDGDGTLVTWSMTGTNNFVGRAFCLLFNMDKLVGGDFERGLANLKKVVEEGG